VIVTGQRPGPQMPSQDLHFARLAWGHGFEPVETPASHYFGQSVPEILARESRNSFTGFLTVRVRKRILTGWILHRVRARLLALFEQTMTVQFDTHPPDSSGRMSLSSATILFILQLAEAPP